MNVDEITFSVEPLSMPGRFRVAWETDTHRYWFNAIIDGDQIERVLALLGSRKRPQVLSQVKTPAAPVRYHDADEFGDVILAATRHIRQEKLASYALERRDRERAEREQVRIAETATRIRSAFVQLEQESDALVEALGLHNDVGPINARVMIGQLSDAYLYRLAVILGCD